MTFGVEHVVAFPVDRLEEAVQMALATPSLLLVCVTTGELDLARARCQGVLDAHAVQTHVIEALTRHRCHQPHYAKSCT